MSFEVDDDTELRDLVSSTLQNSGVLGRIKAELRSNVYLAIEGDQELKKKSKHVNSKLDNFATTSEGRLALQLIREFFIFFGLDYSLLVFEPEAIEGRNVTLRDRESIIENCGFAETINENAPLLSEIIKLSKVSVLKSETPTPSPTKERFSFPINEENDDSLQSEKSSSISMTKPPQQLNKSKDFDMTYTMSTSNAEKPLINALQKTDELPQQKSLLGELPPLMGPQSSTVKNPALSLAPLKKVPPPVAKVEGTKKEDLIKTAKPALEVRPMSKSIENERSNTPSNSVSVDEDIDEEISEFLNSSISASEDLTKEETVSENASLHADYVEKL